jgi:hypothetical protein
MDARALSGLAGADSAAVALDDGELRGTLGGQRQGLIAPRVGVASSGQLGADVMDDSLDRLGGDGHAGDVVDHEGGPLERSGFRRGSGDLQDEGRRQFAGVKAQRFPEREKKTGGISGKTLRVLGVRPARRSRSPGV